MMLRTLDMPVGNGLSAPYTKFLDNIEKGRSVVVIPVLDKAGKATTYIYSGKPEGEVNVRNTFRHITKMCWRAHDAARAEGYTPVSDEA